MMLLLESSITGNTGNTDSNYGCTESVNKTYTNYINDTRGWLERHIDEFVNTRLHNFDGIGATSLNSTDMSIVKSIWRKVKRDSIGKKLILAGRDVFIWEILARRENFPTIFLPQCSRKTSRFMIIENPEDFFLFDTGFAGTIPINLHIENFTLGSAFSPRDQCFPNMINIRNLMLKIEDLPKYWKPGKLDDGSLKQELSDITEFELAARLTVAIYTDKSPRFISKSAPIKYLRWR